MSETTPTVFAGCLFDKIYATANQERLRFGLSVAFASLEITRAIGKNHLVNFIGKHIMQGTGAQEQYIIMELYSQFNLIA